VEEANAWLSLIIGNTRLHWGFFRDGQLISTWHTPHLHQPDMELIANGQFQGDAWQALAEATPQNSRPASLISSLPSPLPNPLASPLPEQPLSPSQLWIASAVPSQTSQWLEAAGGARVVHNSHVPIEGLYGTLGCDRAINLLGAGNAVGWPVLVIDAGTALTFTAAIKTSQGSASFYGGAILPGVRLQRQALGERTAALANALSLSQSIFESSCESATDLPDRWGTDTSDAIASGLVYSLISTITDYLYDWWRRFPKGKVIMTGGDSPRLYALMLQALSQGHGLPRQHMAQQQRTPEIISRVQADCTVDTHLMFWGMRAYRQGILDQSAASRTARNTTDSTTAKS